jgi:hypothetical protein
MARVSGVKVILGNEAKQSLLREDGHPCPSFLAWILLAYCNDGQDVRPTGEQVASARALAIVDVKSKLQPSKTESEHCRIPILPQSDQLSCYPHAFLATPLKKV